MIKVHASGVEKGDRIITNGICGTVESVDHTHPDYSLLRLSDGTTWQVHPDHHVTLLPLREEGFICMSREMTWGWGAGPEAAIQHARKMAGGKGARKGDRYVIALPPGSFDGWVDGMGLIRWRWTVDANREGTTQTIEEPKR